MKPNVRVLETAPSKGNHERLSLSHRRDDGPVLNNFGVALATKDSTGHAVPAAGTALDVELQAKKSRLAEVNASIAALPAVPTATVSKGLLDLLTDGDGVSFHRFQIVVWTVVLGFIFVRAVARDLTMPEFDTTLLGLMGLSSDLHRFQVPRKAEAIAFGRPEELTISFDNTNA